MIPINNHHNEEQVIRFYLNFLPPVYFAEDGSYHWRRNYIRTANLNSKTVARSILDIGSGTKTPYRGNLRKRTLEYAALDIRPGANVNYVADVCDLNIFSDKQWHWGWCAETIEHVSPELKENAAKEIMRVCENAVFTYPTPVHKTFYGDPGHTEVLIDWKAVFSSHKVFIYTAKSGRVIVIIKSS